MPVLYYGVKSLNRAAHSSRDGGSGWNSLMSSVHFPAVSHSHNQDPRSAVLNFVKDSVVPNTDAVTRSAFQFLGSGRAWVLGKVVQMGRQAISDAFGELAELAGCSGGEINTVGHAREL